MQLISSKPWGQKARLAGCLLAVALLVIFVYRNEINGIFGCWAYHDQCTAKRVSGLSAADCSARADSIAYLAEGRICLVRID